jgi:tetratricopeptide (TPR) repeat protein
VSAYSGRKIDVRATLRRLRLLLLALVALGSLTGVPSAQQLSPTERAALQARKEALFQQMLRNPSNLDVTFAYADLSTKLGDNEAAVSALERMLLFNPNLPRVQLELGALYFQMGSYDVAQTYFQKAIAANPPPEVKQRIDTYLAQIARLNSPQQFTGFVFAGVQYQSDANLAPGSPVIASPIGQVLLNSQFVKAADESFFATGSALYSYDLGTQNRDTLEIGGIGFANRYITFTRLDLDVAELTAGPRFNFPHPLADVSAASLKPYVIANDVALGQNQYFHTLGVGGEATVIAWRDWRFKSVFEFRNKNFNSAPDRPLSRGLTGSDKLVSLFLNKPITLVPQSDLTLEFDFLDQDTRLAYFSNFTYAGSAAYHLRYDDPTGHLHFPMDTTFFASIAGSDYAAPDPCCVPFTTRGDTHYRFGVTQGFQVLNTVAIVLQLQRDILSSNIPIYAYTSDSVLIGPQIRF